jgi:hypothetical protein
MKKITFIFIILVLLGVLFSVGCTSGQFGGKDISRCSNCKIKRSFTFTQSIVPKGNIIGFTVQVTS